MTTEPLLRKPEKVNKICMKCGRPYEDYPSDLNHLNYPKKIYKGVCKSCKYVNKKCHYNPNDYGGLTGDGGWMVNKGVEKGV